MSSAKLALAAVVASLGAVAVAGCGAIHVKPVASKSGSRGALDDPRTHLPNRIACLRRDGFAVSKVGATGLQIGTPPAGPSVTFTPSGGAAEADQIEGVAPGAEVIGNALLYPNQASDPSLKKVEGCLAENVPG